VNVPTLREIIRLTYTLVDIWCQSYLKPRQSVVFDIDNRVDVVRRHRQLAQWNAHYDERCFLPIPVYDAATGRQPAHATQPRDRRQARHAGEVIRRRKRRMSCDGRNPLRSNGIRKHKALPYDERACAAPYAINFGAYRLNFTAAFLTASASVAASISPIHVCLEASL
jgi:hypothetical protein